MPLQVALSLNDNAQHEMKSTNLIEFGRIAINLCEVSGQVVVIGEVHQKSHHSGDGNLAMVGNTVARMLVGCQERMQKYVRCW